MEDSDNFLLTNSFCYLQRVIKRFGPPFRKRGPKQKLDQKKLPSGRTKLTQVIIEADHKVTLQHSGLHVFNVSVGHITLNACILA